MADWTVSTQDNQAGSILTALGDDAVFLEGFVCTERMGEPFSIVCEVLSATVVDFGAQLGSAVSVSVQGGDLVARAFHGVLTEAAEIGRVDDAIRYSLVARPWFWLLQIGRNSRIFQKMTARAIIQKVFTDAGVATSAYSFTGLSERGLVVREYCVQYGESDFNFVSRLMEEEGIYYYFAHTADGHTMTFCDAASSHAAFAGGAVVVNPETAYGRDPGLWSWGSRLRSSPTKSTLRDVHFKTPDNNNQAVFTETDAGDGVVTGELFEYPGGFSYLTDDGATAGTDFAKLRLQAARAERLRYAGEGDAFGLFVGTILSTDPLDADFGDLPDVLVTAAVHHLSGQTYIASQGDGGGRLTVSLEGVPSATVWRPALRAVKPLARGPQTATVVGTAGEVIEVDAFGRVRVQFPWDRLDKKNETSSCWIRVSQAWADGGFGQMHIPRIGEEVIVDFLDGDMDRPIITGRVYNATKTVPYTLPDDKTKSTWKSRTVGESGQYPDTVGPPQSTDKGFNEIRFEDKGGSEELYVHAQRLFKAWYRFDEERTTGHNTTVSVGYDRTTTVKHNETKTVSDGDETHTVSTGKRTTSIKGDETLTVETGARATTVKAGDETHEVTAGKRTTSVMGNDALTVKTGNYSVDVTVGTVSVSSPQQIQLKCGASQITMTPASIEIKSPMITVKADGICEVDGAMVKVQGTGMVQVTGGVVMIN